MKLGVISGSVSRNAGGLYESVRRPLQILVRQGRLHCEVFSLSDEYTLEDQTSWKPVTTRTFPIIGPAAFGYGVGFKTALVEYRADVHHAHGIWMYPSLANYLHCKKNSTPYLISPRGMLEPWALKNSSWKKKLVGALFERKHLLQARCLHALTEAEASDIRAYGLKNPICVIPNGINLPDEPVGNNAEQGQEYDKKTLLFIGRIHPKKGLLPLLEAWNIFQQRTPAAKRWQLSIAGWDQLQHENQLKQYVREHELENSVSFLGPLFNSEKEAALRSADAFILPSLSEGLPMSILEAWGYRLPVLMTPECNLPEAFSLNAAIRIEAEKQSMIAGLNRMVEMSSDDLIEIGNRGRALVEQKYTWGHVAEEMLRVYEWSTGAGTAPDCMY